MKRSIIVSLAVVALTLVGCISAERKAEYAEWQASDDGVSTVMLGEFEAKYRQGWRERAEEKKKARLEREEAARALARRQAEYNRWLASDDKEDGVSLEVFEQKYKNGWEARADQKRQARLEREEKARQEERRKAEQAELQRKRSELRDSIAAADLAAIREAYAHGKVYKHVYYRGGSIEKAKYALGKLAWQLSKEYNKERNKQEGSEACKRVAREHEETVRLLKENEQWEMTDWLHDWVEPRLGLSEEGKLEGEALLAAFGEKYMPNAYANFEKVKEAAVELQQVFNEEFPKPWTIKDTSPKWNSFNKVLEKFAKVRTEYFLCHDELCHYWMSYRLGVLTAEDFVKIDSQKVAVKLLPENTSRVGYTIVKRLALEGKAADFAAKYAPESYALYQRFEQEWKQMEALLDEVHKQRLQLDAVRFDRAHYNAIFKYNDLAREMNMLVADFQAWHMDHRTTEKSSEDVAKCDQERAKGLKSFADSLPMYIKERTLGPIIAKKDMVQIPGKYYKMQRTEVTQFQWMCIMGGNPSRFEGPDRPVERVSWEDCNEFIRRLNALDGTNYQLPDARDWNFACLAGSSGEWGMRRNGEVGSMEAMAWCYDNSKFETHPVAMKEPNAFGLYDMHGNVAEWCRNVERANWTYYIGSDIMVRNPSRIHNVNKELGFTDRIKTYSSYDTVGFRLTCTARP